MTFRPHFLICFYTVCHGPNYGMLGINEPPHGKTNKMACAPSEDSSAQSDQSLRCRHEETVRLSLSIERTVKTLIRLGGCPG